MRCITFGATSALRGPQRPRDVAALSAVVCAGVQGRTNTSGSHLCVGGNSALNRQELSTVVADASSRVKKFVACMRDVEDYFLEALFALHLTPPKVIELAVDATGDPVRVLAWSTLPRELRRASLTAIVHLNGAFLLAAMLLTTAGSRSSLTNCGSHAPGLASHTLVQTPMECGSRTGFRAAVRCHLAGTHILTCLHRRSLWGGPERCW